MKLTNSIITIVGKKGTGKTTRIKELLILNKYDQIFVLDYLYEYRLFSSQICHISHDGTKVEEFTKPSWEQCSIALKSVMVFDEIHLYGKNNEDISFIFRCARHANLDIISSSQRFFDLPVIVRSQTDTFNVFQISEPRDLQYLSDFVDKGIINTVRNLETFQYVNLKI